MVAVEVAAVVVVGTGAGDGAGSGVAGCCGGMVISVGFAAASDKSIQRLGRAWLADSLSPGSVIDHENAVLPRPPPVVCIVVPLGVVTVICLASIEHSIRYPAGKKVLKPWMRTG